MQQQGEHGRTCVGLVDAALEGLVMPSTTGSTVSRCEGLAASSMAGARCRPSSRTCRSGPGGTSRRPEPWMVSGSTLPWLLEDLVRTCPRCWRARWRRPRRAMPITAASGPRRSKVASRMASTSGMGALRLSMRRRFWPMYWAREALQLASAAIELLGRMWRAGPRCRGWGRPLVLLDPVASPSGSWMQACTRCPPCGSRRQQDVEDVAEGQVLGAAQPWVRSRAEVPDGEPVGGGAEPVHGPSRPAGRGRR